MQSRKQNERRWLILVLVLAGVIRLLYLLEQWSTSPLFYQLLLDEQEVADSARSLLRGEGFGPEPLFKAPLYTVFIAAVMQISGDGWFLLSRLIQHTLGIILVGIVMDSARRIIPAGKGRTISGIVAGVGTATYGPLVRLENIICLDFLTVFLQTAMLWSLIRLYVSRQSQWAFWSCTAGALAALAWLTRPTLLPVLPLLAVWIFFALRKRSRCCVILAAKNGVLFFIIPLFTMAGFGARNLYVSNELLFLPWQGGYNFYEANRPGATGRYFVQRDFSWSEHGNPTRSLAIRGWQNATESIGEIRFGELDRFWRQKALTVIKEDPVLWINLMTRKFIWLFSEREIFNYEDYDVQKSLSQVLSRIPIGFGHVWPLALTSLAFLGAPLGVRRPLHLVLWLYLLSYGFAVALYYVSGRLRMPLALCVIILAGFACGAITQLFMRSRWKLVPLVLMLFAAGGMLSWYDWWGVRSESVAQFDYLRMSNAAFRDQQPGKALEYAEQAERLDPRYPTIPVLKGQAYYALGEVTNAAKEFEVALNLLEDPVPAYNLGIIRLYHEGRTSDSLVLFRNAIKREPKYSAAYHKAAIASIGLGDFPGAQLYLSNTNSLNETISDYGARAVLATAQGNTTTAVSLIRKALDQNPEEARASITKDFQAARLEVPPGGTNNE